MCSPLVQAQSLAESRPPREEKKKKKGSKAAEVDPAAQAMLDQLRAEGRHDEADALVPNTLHFMPCLMGPGQRLHARGRGSGPQ